MSKPPLTTSQLRSVWGPACNVRLERYAFRAGAGVVSVDARIVDAVRALDACLLAHRYATRAADTGAFVCRQITGGTGYSLHAYGIAIDINWQTNPYSAANRLVTDMPAAMVADITAMRTATDAPVWGWGGNYRTVKDAMHFEIVCTPADLATGIRGGPSPMADLIDQIRTELVNADERAKARETKMVADILAHVDDQTSALRRLIGQTKRGVKLIGTHTGLTDKELAEAFDTPDVKGK